MDEKKSSFAETTVASNRTFHILPQTSTSSVLAIGHAFDDLAMSKIINKGPGEAIEFDKQREISRMRTNVPCFPVGAAGRFTLAVPAADADSTAISNHVLPKVRELTINLEQADYERIAAESPQLQKHLQGVGSEAYVITGFWFCPERSPWLYEASKMEVKHKMNFLSRIFKFGALWSETVITRSWLNEGVEEKIVAVQRTKIRFACEKQLRSVEEGFLVPVEEVKRQLFYDEL